MYYLFKGVHCLLAGGTFVLGPREHQRDFAWSSGLFNHNLSIECIKFTIVLYIYISMSYACTSYIPDHSASHPILNLYWTQLNMNITDKLHFKEGLNNEFVAYVPDFP